MNPKKFFRGQTETYLLERLEEEGVLKFEDVYSAYSQREAGRAFLSKLIHFNIGFVSAPGTMSLNQQLNQQLKEEVKEEVKEILKKDELKHQVKNDEVVDDERDK